MNKWTQKEIDILRTGLQKGLTASEIARILKTRTRNAVIGYTHRADMIHLRVKYFNMPIKKEEVKTLPRIVRKARHARKMTHAPTYKPPEFKPKPKPELLTESPHPVTLFGLKANMCKAILGEVNAEKTLYCGNSTDVTSSWCPYHRSLYYVPMSSAKVNHDEIKQGNKRDR